MNPELKEVIGGAAFYGGIIAAGICLAIIVGSLLLEQYFPDTDNARKKISAIGAGAFGLVAFSAWLSGFTP